MATSEIINKIKRPIFSLEQLLIKCYAASSSSYFLLPLMFVVMNVRGVLSCFFNTALLSAHAKNYPPKNMASS